MISLDEIRKVVIGSQNPVKISAVKEVLAYYLDYTFEIVGLPALSGVSDMPNSEDEVKMWSYNRAQWCMKQGDYDMSFGLEWWVQFDEQGCCFLFGCVTCIDKTWYSHMSLGTQYMLPPAIAEKLSQWAELWPVMDEFLGMKNTKQQGWAIWFLTEGKISRKDSFADNAIHVLIPWLHRDLYEPS